jgi:hypothetical protein
VFTALFFHFPLVFHRIQSGMENKVIDAYHAALLQLPIAPDMLSLTLGNCSTKQFVTVHVPISVENIQQLVQQYLPGDSLPDLEHHPATVVHLPDHYTDIPVPVETVTVATSPFRSSGKRFPSPSETFVQKPEPAGKKVKKAIARSREYKVTLQRIIPNNVGQVIIPFSLPTDRFLRPGTPVGREPYMLIIGNENSFTEQEVNILAECMGDMFGCTHAEITSDLKTVFIKRATFAIISIQKKTEVSQLLKIRADYIRGRLDTAAKLLTELMDNEKMMKEDLCQVSGMSMSSLEFILTYSS